MVYRFKKPGKRGIMPADKVRYYNKIDMGIFLFMLETCLEHENYTYERTLFLDTPTYKVDNYIGKTKNEIKLNQFYKYQFYGEGNTVIYQSPEPGEKIKEGDTIMFYLG